MPERRRLGLWFFGELVLVLVVLDQFVKFWARHTLAQGQSHAVWPGVFELKLTYNRGIAFGLLEGVGAWFVPVALAIVAWGVWFCLRHPYDRRSSHVAMALLSAGALGNMVDRVWHGKVTDMFWIRAINFPVFNVADVCITIAVVLFLLATGSPTQTQRFVARESKRMEEAEHPS